ncbi:uncharacterized protein GGS22DRAFT_188967 [Annulohypoxylon maeteangense]|uniref:uncharacterized protein n=1 Tax=Annulohypoxylon maeteangense TaxID=1927788 RepID=UPI0020074AF7|nr:uncharacterized protein GGS22DRAFT_188967 [Annulohypoxylon maeteangense]KAI0884757.1 hypothetical protein GGS22DRAFT_188967 [Annulohypoxylon maeteangense]
MAAKIDNMNTSAAEQKFFTTLFKYLPKTLDMDWDDFAKEMGFKDVTIAKTRFGQIRRKYAVGKHAGGATPSPLKANPHKVKKPKAARKGRAKKQGAGLDWSDDDEKKSIFKGALDGEKKVIKGGRDDDQNGFVKKETVSGDEK